MKMEEANFPDCPNKRLRVSMDVTSGPPEQHDETGEVISSRESSREANLTVSSAGETIVEEAEIAYTSSLGLPGDCSRKWKHDVCSSESNMVCSTSDMGDGMVSSSDTESANMLYDIHTESTIGKGHHKLSENRMNQTYDRGSSKTCHACPTASEQVTSIHETGALAENLYIQRRETEKLGERFNEPSLCSKNEGRTGYVMGDKNDKSISGGITQCGSESQLLRERGASYFPLSGSSGVQSAREREIHCGRDKETVELSDSGFIEMFSNSVMSRMISSCGMSISEDSIGQSHAGHDLKNINETNMDNSDEDDYKNRINKTENVNSKFKPTNIEHLYLMPSENCEKGDGSVRYHDYATNNLTNQPKPSFQVLKTRGKVIKDQEAMQVNAPEDANGEFFVKPPNELFQIDSDYLNNVVKQSGINMLPPNILLHMLRYLSAHTLLRTASCVCKYWYNLTRDSALWKEISLKNQHKLTDTTLIQLIRFSDRTTKVNLTDCRFVTDHGVQALVRRCKHLQTLILMRCFDITDKAFEGLQEQGLCPRLQALHLDGCCKISDKAIVEVSGACPLLRSLHLNQCNKISDASIVKIADNCPWLRQLLLDHCDKVTDVGLSAVVLGCPNLSYLNIMSCGVTDTGVRQLGKLSSLTNLDLSNIPRLTPEAVVYVARFCQRLECINISLNSVMNDQCVAEVARHLPDLKRLYCVSCCISDTGLEEIAKLRPTLEALDVGWCQDVTDHGVRIISYACANLDYFGLIRCDRVTLETIEELALKFPRVNYSTFVLESRKLLERARRDGYQFLLPKVR